MFMMKKISITEIFCKSTYYWQCIETAEFSFFTWLLCLENGLPVEIRVILSVMDQAIYLRPLPVCRDHKVEGHCSGDLTVTQMIHAFTDKKYLLNIHFCAEHSAGCCL